VYDNGDGSSDDNSDDHSNDSSSGNGESNALPDAYKNWDTTWIKDKISNWHGLGDDEFKQRWQTTVDNTWASKFKWERPEWAK
jgi:hypothetical protein